MSAGPRIPPLSRDQWSDEAVEAVRAGFGDAAAERLLATGLKKFDPNAEVPKLEEGPRDKRFVYEAPQGGLVVKVTSKVLGDRKSVV